MNYREVNCLKIIVTLILAQNIVLCQKVGISTSFSDPETIVIQVSPDILIEEETVNGNKAYGPRAIVFVPFKESPDGFLFFTLKEFQIRLKVLYNSWVIGKENIPGWVIRKEIMPVFNLESPNIFSKVRVTSKVKEKEVIIDLPFNYNLRLLNFFKQDIEHNKVKFHRYDCQSFTRQLVNVESAWSCDDFDLQKNKEPAVGEVVVLTTGELNFPCDENPKGTVRHWAIYVGDNLYLSKFGATTENKGTNLVGFMDLEGMKKLFNCRLHYVAYPGSESNPWMWNGYEY